MTKGGAKKYIVDIWGQPEEVFVYQRSKTVFIASGFYMGKSIEKKAPSEKAAKLAWQRAAENPNIMDRIDAIPQRDALSGRPFR